MSLNWDTTNCPNGSAKDATEEELSWLEVLTFTTMLLDVRVIDDEALFRIRFLERLGVNLARENGQPVAIPLAAIERWRGLTVNVSPVARNTWINRKAKIVREEVERAVANEILASV